MNFRRLASLAVFTVFAPLASASGPELPSAPFPACFVENLGQWDTPAAFVARGDGGWVRAEPNRVILQREEDATGSGVVVALEFEGAETRTIEGRVPVETAFHYFPGRDPDRWRSNVPAYEQLLYRDVYPGVDVRVRDHAGLLEYDLLLAPGSDLEQVRIRYEGVDSIEIPGPDRLVLMTALGPIEQRIPATWTESTSGERRPLDCRYRRIDEWTIGFEVDPYSPENLLVIDPSLEWSTVVGGVNRDEVLDHTVSAAGRIFATGFSDGTDFPNTRGAYDNTANGQSDVVMFQLSPDGTALLAATYIGGSDLEQGNAIGVTSNGDVLIAGLTDSSDFPTTPGAWDTVRNGRDGFLLQLNGSGSALQWSTFLGGSAGDAILGMWVNPGNGRSVVCGTTNSADFPVSLFTYDHTYNGGGDAFVTSFDATGQLVYSTFVGGSDSDRAVGLAADPNNDFDVTVTGDTDSTDFPTTGSAFQSGQQGSGDAFVFRLSSSAFAILEMSTYLGGSASDRGSDLTLDSFGNATIVGTTSSSDFPTLGAWDATYNGGVDTFVTNVNANGTALFYSTFLGGSDDDFVGGIYAEQTLETLFIAGETLSPDFPLSHGAFRTDFSGREVFALRMSGNAAELQYSTFLGRGGASSIELDPNSGDAVVAGWAGTGFVTTPGSYDSTHNGGRDGFVTKIRLGPILKLVGRLIPGNSLHYEVTGAPSSETGFQVQVLSSCTGTAGIPLPNSGGLVLPLTFDVCTQFSLSIAVLFQGTIQSDGTATTPSFTWPNVNPGINIFSAAFTRDPANGTFSSVTPPIHLVTQ